jgi:hypothetical protein
MDANLRERPVFICGHPKSGTSLVRAILDAHPQLVVYPEETVFFRRFLPQAAGLGFQDQLDLAERCLIHIFTWNRENPPASQAGFPDRDYSSISYAAVNQAMRRLAGDCHRHPGDILSAAVLAFGEASGQMDGGKRRWVEKSPYNELFAGQIFTWWPEARCLHILRDPRDNFASYRRKHPDWSAEFFAANWRRSTQAGIKNRERFGDERYRLLKYEDLVQSPEEHLRQLAEFLGIAWDAGLTSPTRAGEAWIGNSMFADRFQGISAAPLSRWRDSLAAGEASVIEAMTRQWLENYEYPLLSNSQISIRKRLTARWRVVSFPIRRKARHWLSKSLSRPPAEMEDTIEQDDQD